VMKNFVCLLGRIHGIFCGEECCGAVRKNTWYILCWRVLGDCKEEYMAYFVVKSVLWLLGRVHVIFSCEQCGSGWA